MFSELYFICRTFEVHLRKNTPPRRCGAPALRAREADCVCGLAGDGVSHIGIPVLQMGLVGVVVLENVGPDRVVLHDRKSGIGCSSSTTLFVIAAGALSETGKCILSTVGLVESNAMTAGPTESNAMAVGAAESNAMAVGAAESNPSA